MALPLDLPRVLIDADVLFAAAASSSEHGASLLILRLAELTLIQAFAPEQVMMEVQRNLQVKLPQALNTYRVLVERSIQVVPDPPLALVQKHQGKAHPKDLPILVSADEHQCTWLITFNLKDYKPGLPSVKVVRPGDFIVQVRRQLSVMTGALGDT